MTADWARLPKGVLAKDFNRIVNEVHEIHGLVYDITCKPVAMNEWEEVSGTCDSKSLNGDGEMSYPTNTPLLPAQRQPIPPAPIHPLAALSTIVLDNVFGVFEITDPFILVLTSIGVGTLNTVTTMLVQRFLARDGWGASIAKGLVMGIIAGVPFQVTGTAVGIPLLAWAGLHEWVKLPGIKNKQGQLPESDEIVDAEVRDIK